MLLQWNDRIYSILEFPYEIQYDWIMMCIDRMDILYCRNECGIAIFCIGLAKHESISWILKEDHIQRRLCSFSQKSNEIHLTSLAMRTLFVSIVHSLLHHWHDNKSHILWLYIDEFYKNHHTFLIQRHK